MKNAIFITGTPCTGKTTVSEILSGKLNCKLIKINDLAIENNFVLGIDEDKGYKVIDIDALNDKVSEIISSSEELTIFEGHLSHLCSGADKVIVLRLVTIQNQRFVKTLRPKHWEYVLPKPLMNMGIKFLNSMLVNCLLMRLLT